ATHTTTLSLHDALPIYSGSSKCLYTFERVGRHHSRYRLILHLSRESRALHSGQVQRARSRSWRRRCRSPGTDRGEREAAAGLPRSEEHTSELQSQSNLV